jgi:hypothetical protein
MSRLRRAFRHRAARVAAADGERGAATAEYVAVVTLVVMMLLAVSPGPTGEYLTDAVRAAICRIGGEGACAPAGAALGDEAFRPAYCTLSQRTYQGGAAVTFKQVEVGGGLEYIRADRSDGITEFTVIDESSLGLRGEVGTLAEARVGLTGRLGTTWETPTDQAADVERRLLAREGLGRVAERVTNGSGGFLARWASDRVFGSVDAPQRKFSEGGLDASASVGWPPDDHSVSGMSGPLEMSIEGSVGAVIGRELDRNGHDDPAMWTESTYLQVNLEATGVLGFQSGGGSRTGVVKVERDARDEIVSITTESSVSLEAGAELDREWSGPARPDSGASGSEARRRGRSSELGASGSGLLVETVTIPIESAEERRVAEDWVGSWSQLRSAASGAVPEHEPLAGLAQSKGTIVEAHFDDHRLGAGGDVDVGGRYGVAGSVSVTDRSPVSQHFRGAPDATGTRALVPFDCGG